MGSETTHFSGSSYCTSTYIGALEYFIAKERHILFDE
jgi:hypothetical protein